MKNNIKIDIDSLSKSINKTVKAISMISKTLTNAITSIDWKEIQRKLTVKEVNKNEK